MQLWSPSGITIGGQVAPLVLAVVHQKAGPSGITIGGCWWMLVGAPESWCGIPPRLPKYPPPFSAVLSVVGCEAIQLKYTFSIAFKDQLYRIT